MVRGVQMVHGRDCVQCGTAFTPRREHARFCTARCRMTWNQEHDGVAAAPVAAIDWSVIAMAEAADRFAWATDWDLAHTAAVVAETVWWITLVDATLVRYQPREYENMLAGRGKSRRRKTEESLTGLRYVRNQLGCSVDPATLIRPFVPAGSVSAGSVSAGRSSSGGSSAGSSSAGSSSAGSGTAWTWNPLPEPDLEPLPETAREWELSRYRAYQARVADHDVARVFARCAGFLETAASAYAKELIPAGLSIRGSRPRSSGGSAPPPDRRRHALPGAAPGR